MRKHYGDLGAERLSRLLNWHLMSRVSFFCAIIEAHCFIDVASCVNVVFNTLIRNIMILGL